MYIHHSKLRVRYAHTDQMGYVYYGNYASFYEVGRVEAMRNLGLRYADLEEEQNIIMPVMSMETKFIRPALYDELLSLETRISKLPTDTIKFRTDIYNEKKELVNSGIVKLYFVDKKTKQRIETPSILIDKLKQYFE